MAKLTTKINKAITGVARYEKDTKKTIQERILHYQERGLECDPIKVLMEIAAGKELNEFGEQVPLEPAPPPVVRQMAASELATYLYPKLKSVELVGDKDRPISFTVALDEDPVLSRQEADKILNMPKAQLLEIMGGGSSAGVLPPADDSAD